MNRKIILHVGHPRILILASLQMQFYRRVATMAIRWWSQNKIERRGMNETVMHKVIIINLI